MNTVNPFTPMSFYMLDYSVEEAEDLLKNSKLLNAEQKTAILEEYKEMLNRESQSVAPPVRHPELSKDYKPAV